MPNVVVVGAQWGDEGKGKVVDLLTQHAEVVVRFQGGNNAGHTLVVNGEKTVQLLVPGKDGVRRLADARQLLVSEAAHAIFPWHKELDAVREQARGAQAIGTTGRGIGP